MTTRLFPFLFVLACAACGRHSIPETPAAPPAPLRHAPAQVLVGSARADLTMPPGPATFGHGPDSRASEGFWTRTYCRVFYFETLLGHKLALVPCELPAMSALLQRAVAERVKEHLHASQIMMTATHTHAGVGHYFGARQYTGIFSTRIPGYDDAILRRLADRIAEALLAAIESKRPARLRWKHASDFWCFTRNRSLSAYRLNREPFVAPSPAPCTRDHPDLAAVDPGLSVLKIDAFEPAAPDVDQGPIGSLSFFAMHPTVLHNTNQLFGGDVFGVVSRELEAELRRETCRKARARGAECPAELDPLHAVVNTNEGDISPVWSRGEISEAIELGQRVARFIWERHPTELGPPEAVVASRYAEEDITKAEWTEAGRVWKLCPYGQVGQGAARGGNDHATSVAPLAMFSMASPVDFTSTSCHAPKIPLLGLVSRITREPGSFPTTLPFSVAMLADTLVAFVPAELTITVGDRLKRRVRGELAAFPGAPQNVVIAGLANEYIQYVATPDEYALQDYEGASTLFGPNSEAYVTRRAALLARSLFDPKTAEALQVGHALELGFGFGRSLDTGIETTGASVARGQLGTCTMPEPPGGPPKFCMRWRDAGPGGVGLGSAPWVMLVSGQPSRRARICAPGALGTCDHGAFIDDRGFEFRTRIHESVGDAFVWSTLFSPTEETWSELRTRSVRIRIEGTPPVESSPISASEPPPRCSLKEARLCLLGVRTDQWDGLVPLD